MKAYFELLRVKSWIKNSFVLFPLIFSLKLFDIRMVYTALTAFLLFCLCSSFVYILNDILDYEKDRLHPAKSKRPIASERIGIRTAWIISGVLLFTIILLLASLKPLMILLIGSYIVLNILYSLVLKRINLIESLIISLNFLLRILTGCFAISVVPSDWIIVVTVSVSLFLVFVKRKSELRLLGPKATEHRLVLGKYSEPLLDKYIYITATLVLISYILYTIDDEVSAFFGTNRLMYTSVFVLLGILRFIQLSDSDEYEREGDPTTLILKDRFIQIVILCWLTCTIFILYSGF